MKILLVVLIAISAMLSLKHGWDSFRPATPEQLKMMTDLGINKRLIPYFGLLSIAMGLMLLFPQTFFISNLLNAIVILMIISLSLKAGNIKMAFIEIPFLVLPLLLIWLKHIINK